MCITINYKKELSSPLLSNSLFTGTPALDAVRSIGLYIAISLYCILKHVTLPTRHQSGAPRRTGNHVLTASNHNHSNRKNLILLQNQHYDMLENILSDIYVPGILLVYRLFIP